MASPALRFAIDKFDITSSLPLDPRRHKYREANIYHAHADKPLRIQFPDQEPEDDQLVFDPHQRLVVPEGAEGMPLITLAKGVHEQAMNVLVAHGLPVRHLGYDPTPDQIRELSGDSIALGFRTHIHDLFGKAVEKERELAKQEGRPVDLGNIDLLSPLTAFAVRAGIGVTDDVADIFTTNNAVIERTPGPNRFAVATWTFRKIIEVLRQMPFHLMQRNMDQLALEVQEGHRTGKVKLIEAKRKWSIEEYDKPLQWDGNGVGVVGVGGIGGYLTDLLLKEGATVVTHDIDESQYVRGARHVGSLEALIQDDSVRVFSLHVSGEDPVWTPEHTALLRQKHRELAAQGIDKKWVLINTSRGKVIQREKDIEELVDDGILELAVLDVFREEHDWYRDDMHLRMLGDKSRYNLSPHALGSSIESDVGNAQDLAYSILTYLLYGVMDHPMNAPQFPPTENLFKSKRGNPRPDQIVLLHILHRNDERVISGAKQALGTQLAERGLKENMENSTLRGDWEPGSVSMYSATMTLRHNGSGPIDHIPAEILRTTVDTVSAYEGIMRAWVTEILR